jgi:hypothetical protein
MKCAAKNQVDLHRAGCTQAAIAAWCGGASHHPKCPHSTHRNCSTGAGCAWCDTFGNQNAGICCGHQGC